MAGNGESVGTAVLGAGPAGLTAAYVLGLRGAPAVVYESDGLVGGIAKTVEYKGYRFDLGGHRFFTKLAPIQRLWEEVMGEDFLVRPRLSRIYYDGKYLAYPLLARDVIARLGLVESALCALSYFRCRVSSTRTTPETFEEWVTWNFGSRLYDAFFASYTEKVWGIPGSEIHAEWAAQRIKDFSFGKALLRALHLSRQTPTTLIEEFRYPRLGPGQLWENMQARVEDKGVDVKLRHRATAIHHDHGRVHQVTVEHDGRAQTVPVDAVISTMALHDLILGLDPAPPDDVVAAAEKLRYRALCLVALMSDQEEPFPDNWIYLHDPGTRAGRVQNFGAWSPDMVRPGTTCLGVEYFCFEGDDIWEMPDDEAVALATDELARIDLIDPARVTDGVKVRVPKAYPMYDANYEDAVPVLHGYLAGFDNLKTCGRNGLHRYNNQDHSMWTAILATLNLVDGTEYDVWSVNTEAEYHEEGEAVDAVLDVDLVG
ncbi:MAG TPA: NAD(P)/FAD-dependent oxidoreductase [Gaiellaceae bacterium]|nr:NAD(P)/FAD-dependent oxidoreductase [Gaiellaceae bacterium]